MGFLSGMGFTAKKVTNTTLSRDAHLHNVIAVKLSNDGYDLVRSGPVSPGDEVLSADGETWEPSKSVGRNAGDPRYRIVRRPRFPITNPVHNAVEAKVPRKSTSRSVANTAPGEIAMEDSIGKKVGGMLLEGAKAKLSQKAITLCREAAVTKLSSSNPAVAAFLASNAADAFFAVGVPIAFMYASSVMPTNKLVGKAASLMEPGLVLGAAHATDVLLEELVMPMVTALLSSGLMEQLTGPAEEVEVAPDGTETVDVGSGSGSGKKKRK